jgi:hypothetical protein
MHTLAQKSNSNPQTDSARSTAPGRGQSGQSTAVKSILHLQRTIGNQAVQRMLQAHGNPLAGALQTKLAVSEPGDPYEQEADRISEQVMRMAAPGIAGNAPPAIRQLDAGTENRLAASLVQRLCTECEEEAVQRKAESTAAGVQGGWALREPEAKVNAVSGGQPLTSEQRAFFEPRFGADFSSVRIHTGHSADTAARAVGAYAYTRGSDIVFRQDPYHPDTQSGRRLLAHELTHVVQQGAATPIQRLPENEAGVRFVQDSMWHTATASHVLQRWPGDGMLPPGDCDWATYIVLRGSVETAKAVVSTLGACSPGDSCIFLATKIAAITAEIAARVALDTTCFRGGDEGHRQQVQDKINMMNRCYRFFNASNCSPELIAAMAIVVERAREVIAAAAVVVAAALIVALIAAIIALAEAIAAAIAAAAAAAAEAAAIAAAAAAVIALLVTIRDQLSSGESPGA